jgi:hypothetical protein
VRLLGVLLLALALGGCAEPSEEDELREVVERYVKSVKTNNGDTLCKLLTGRPLAEAQASGACDLAPHGARGFAQEVGLEHVRIRAGRATADLVQGRSVAALSLVQREGFWFIDGIELVRSELRVPDGSLAPDLEEGEMVLVDATAYDAASPRPGDIVAVEDPEPVLRRVEREAGGKVRLVGGTEVATEDVIGEVDPENASPAGG